MNKTLLLVVIAQLAAACSDVSDSPAQRHDHVASPFPPAASQPRSTLPRIPPSADYPLKTCVVCGAELGGSREQLAYSYKGAEVQLSCADCLAKFESDPATYLSKIPQRAK